MSSTAANVKKTSAVTPCKTIRGHTKAVTGVAHLPGGQHIITCSFDSSLRLWDIRSGAQVGSEWRDEGDEARINAMSLSPNGKTIVSGSSDRTVRLWDVETGKVVIKWKGHTAFVRSVCWSPNGRRVVSGSQDGTARVWDVESGEPVEGLNPIKTGHGSVCAVSYSPEASMIATGGLNNGIKIWDAKTGELLSTIELDRTVWSLTWTSDEKKLVAGCGNDPITIFDTATWQQIAVLEGHRSVVSSLTLFPNDRLLASTSWDKTARLWNLDTNLEIGPPLQHKNFVTCAAFSDSADGILLPTAGWQDENVYVWDIQAILKTAGLEDLLFIPDVSANLTPTRYLIPNGYQAQKSGLKNKELHPSSSFSSVEHTSLSEPSQDIEDNSFLEADATQGFDQFGAHELLPGFFDSPQVDAHSPAIFGARLRFSALLGRFPYLLHRSEPNQATETQQPPVPSESRSRVLFDRLSSLLRSPPNTDEISEPSQPPMLSRLSPRVLLGDLSGLFSRPQIHVNEATEPWRSQTPGRSRSDALIGPLSSLFRSPPNADEAIELQCCPGPTTSHLSRHVDDVAAMRDREVLVVARRPDTASEIARRVKNPKPWNLSEQDRAQTFLAGIKFVGKAFNANQKRRTIDQDVDNEQLFNDDEVNGKPAKIANATRRPPIRPAPRQVPSGFFDNVQDGGPSSTTRRRVHPDPFLHRLRNAFAPSWVSRPRALLPRLPSLFHRSPPNTDVLNEPQQRPLGPGTSSRRSPSVVDVPALDDKKALYVARRPERASDKAKRVDNSKWWARVVLFLCCASPSNDDGH
ncbi:WD40-repeat-containing domain protein [Suillus plorans]|uniref:WD40-repeat-containing domain protein n=1 Tax=Suillus plorans TaxID=116603 RepID=A0A9P7AAD7_9AGAM|nr:WD40-repeat-containing domain protein [Suillus plorans]KAG1785362.1 WD40-repeat-containing domain protein [Suillus plorans]